MKKVGILTFFGGRNYGAALQCYALQITLKKLGVDAEVIKFKKEKVYGKLKGKFSNYLSKAYLARKIYAIPYIFQLKKKDRNFDNFFKKYFNFGTKDVISEDSIDKYVKKYETIIFGSDQIWNLNPKIYDRSKIFFGDFNYSGKKVSYSASFGDSINDAKMNKEYIKDKLSKFNSISVREKSGCDFLRDIGISSKLTVDPTMLLSSVEWDKLIDSTPVINGRYILYYSVNCRKYSWIIAKKLSKLTGLQVINLVEHPKIIGSGFKNYYSAGPIEFLNIIKNAEYVVTNSFHGTIFSIIFKKKFIPAFDENNGKIKIEERKYSILKLLKLDNLIKTNSSKISLEEMENIYNRNIDELLKNIVNDSINYLEINK